MEELETKAYLINEELFERFKKQLKKDFETSGVEAGFAENLLPEWISLKEVISRALQPQLKNSSSLSALLYRIDINESEIQQYQIKHPEAPFEEIIAELIIKRILQKVVLKKKFSV
jgi:hypothetical protein